MRTRSRRHGRSHGRHTHANVSYGSVPANQMPPSLFDIARIEPVIVEGVEPVVIAHPYIGFQFAEVVNRQIWIHAHAFKQARRGRTGNTIISYRTANGLASFPSLCAPYAARDAVDQVHQRLERWTIMESPEACAWLQNPQQHMRGARFQEPGSDLALVEELYRLGAKTVRIRGSREQGNSSYADMVTVVISANAVEAQPLMEFLAHEALDDYGCTMEPDNEPLAFILGWR